MDLAENRFGKTWKHFLEALKVDYNCSLADVCRERHLAARQHHRDFGDALVVFTPHIDRLAVTGGDVHAFEEGRVVVRLPCLAPSCVRRLPFLRLLHRHGGFLLSGSRFSRSRRLARHHPHQQLLVDGLLIPLLLHSLPV